MWTYNFISFVDTKKIIIIGKVGAGKSAIGNRILGQKNFFESRQSFSSVTDVWKAGTCIKNENRYFVVDTPGVKGLEKPSKDAIKQLARCFLATSPGFHCIVLVISGTQRIDEPDKTMIKDFADMLGEEAYEYMLVVFTGVKPEKLDPLIKSSTDITELCDKCNYLSFGDDTDEAVTARQVDEFFEKINLIFANNIRQPSFYHPMYEDATKLLQQDAQNIMKKMKNISLEDALLKARKEALEGKSSQDEKLVKLLRKHSIKCCWK